MIPLTKLPSGRSAILAEIGGSRSVRQRLLRYGLSTGVPISRYAAAPLRTSGVWRQGSLLIALRDRTAADLLCQTEEGTNE